MEALWSAALPLLRQHVGERNFTAWIEPIRCTSSAGEAVEKRETTPLKGVY